MIHGSHVNNPNLKLSDDDVRKIRRIYPDMTYEALGKKFGVSKTTIGDVVNHKTHVSNSR